MQKYCPPIFPLLLILKKSFLLPYFPPDNFNCLFEYTNWKLFEENFIRIKNIISNEGKGERPHHSSHEPVSIFSPSQNFSTKILRFRVALATSVKMKFAPHKQSP